MRTSALTSRRGGPASTLVAALVATPLALGLSTPVAADVSTKIATLPYTQAWSDAGLITVNDDWSGVTGVQGYLGQDITTSTGVNPQTLTGESAVALDTDVVANQTASATNGGVVEVNGDTIAIQGSGTADAPYVAFRLDLTGQTTSPSPSRRATSTSPPTTPPSRSPCSTESARPGPTRTSPTATSPTPRLPAPRAR